jgi:hypothetical protein
MVSPEVPGGDAKRQAIFDHQSYGQGNDPLGVVTAGGCQAGQIDAEMESAGDAIVPGVNHLEDTRSVAQEAAEVVKGTLAEGVAIRGTPAPWARSAAITA